MNNERLEISLTKGLGHDRTHPRLDRGLIGAEGGTSSGSSRLTEMYTGKRGTPPSVNS
jgi:hypothetical protein